MAAIVDGSVINVKRVSHRHEQIVDLMLSHPGESKAWIASQLGYTAPWLSTVINSDVFKEYYALRRGEANKAKLDALFDKQLAVANQAYTKVSEYLSGDEIDPQLAFTIATGTANQVAPPTKRTVIEEKSQSISIPVDQTLLAEARQVLKRSVIEQS